MRMSMVVYRGFQAGGFTCSSTSTSASCSAFTSCFSSCPAAPGAWLTASFGSGAKYDTGARPSRPSPGAFAAMGASITAVAPRPCILLSLRGQQTTWSGMLCATHSRAARLLDSPQVLQECNALRIVAWMCNQQERIEKV